MKLKKYLAVVLSFTTALSCMTLPSVSAQNISTDTNGYGTVTENADGSITLNFGENSITAKGGGNIITDENNGYVLRPDNLKTGDDNLAVLTLGSVNLKETDYNSVEIKAASKNSANVSVKVGNTEVAVFSDINNNSWEDYRVSSETLKTTDAEGNVTLNITGKSAKTYCGNYINVRFYNSNASEVTGTPTLEPTTEPIVTPDPNKLPYLDTSLSFEERAADLVSRMTLEEKVSQIGYKAAAIPRLGVSAYNYWREALHGVARQGKATSFPSPLSMSNTWNRDLIYEVADATSTEARAKNPNTDLSYWSPTVNMARDPRWGRNEESYGEDPYLTGQLGIEFVKGMQGDDDKYLKTISTLKHFAANNNEKNRRGGTSVMSEFNFRNYYTKVFQNITEEVMPASFMSSYNATTIYRNGELLYNYKPSAANPYLLTELLRRNWGFDGYVTSDCGAGEDLIKNSAYKQGMFGSSDVSNAEAVSEAFLSGLDIECYLGGGCAATTNGLEAVNSGYMSEEYLETVIYRLFLQRFRTGEFDDNSTYSDIQKSELEKQEHIDIAEKAAEESWVLLKNEDNILPLASTAKNIAVVGNYLSEVVLGDYSGDPEHIVTPLEGLNEEIKKTNPNAQVNYLGGVTNDFKMFNLKSLTLVKENGTKSSIDLSKAENVLGMTLQNAAFAGVTKTASAVIKNVDFTDVVSVEAEMSTELGSMGGTVIFHYGSENGPDVARIVGGVTNSANDYQKYLGAYTGADGGYGGVTDLYIGAEYNMPNFSVENYKTELDNADVIIAYAGTTTADSKESNDRNSILLPSHQSHVDAVTSAYPNKTIVAIQSVGEIDTEPFEKNAKAILWTSYNGQTQGTAFAKIITGQVNPSGKLTTTWYTSSDVSKMELANTTKTMLNGIEGYYTNYDLQSNGKDLGHTYQYYTGTPIYPFGYGLSYTNFEYSNISIDKTDVDANGTVVISADVKNTGFVTGKEIVQLYVSHPKSNDVNIPIKQLKGFEKVELKPNENKKVKFTLNVADMNLFSEKKQKTYVPNGEYIVTVSKNADDTSLKTSFNVTGTLNSILKTVKTIPDGVSLNGLICEDGTNLKSVTNINSKLSAIMSDEVWVDLSKAEVQYTSSDTSIATVNADGIVSSGSKEGLATITAKVTVDGVTKTSSYPVINKLEIKPNDDEILTANATLQAVYDKLPKAAYSAANLVKLDEIYNNAKTDLENVSTKEELNSVLSKAINDLNAVPLDNLAEEYNIVSENSAYIEKGVIDYRSGGIEMYNGAVGTITNANPYTGIQLKVYDKNGNAIESSKVMWQIQKFDNSARKVADIDNETGILTVYGNGIIQITAANIEDMTCGKLMVQVNMQIEAEYADNGNGVTLNDIQGEPSGGYNIGNTGDAWIEYKSVKLSNLKNIAVRYAGKNTANMIVSFDKNKDTENIIASSSLTATGGWGTWAESGLTLDTDVINNAVLNGKLDQYGCATIYIQTNGMNLDYFRMNYIENDDREPYVIEKISNKTDGKMKATLSYRGSVLASDVVMITAVYNNNSLKNVSQTTICGMGEYEIETGAKEGDDVKFFIWNSLEKMKPLSQTVSKIYQTPVDSEIVVYSLDSTDFDYTKLTSESGSDDGVQYPTVNGLSGYSSLENAKSVCTYTYTDVNEKTYEMNFTKAWKGGAGGETKRCLYFTPKAPCKVTVVFDGDGGRIQYIAQDGKKLAEGSSIPDKKVAFSAEITDISKPVYTYGGGSNKFVSAIIVEYYGKETSDIEVTSEKTDNDIAVQYTMWGNTNMMLTKNESTGESKVWSIISDDLKTELSTDYFYESDIDYTKEKLTINALAEYKDRLYAGCDNGLVIVFTECVKCYKLKKVADIHIKQMKIIDGVMYASDGVNEHEINMSDIGGDFIEADEALLYASNGGILVDVRSAEEFEEKSIENSVNMPVDKIEKLLDLYDRETALIFYCSAGTRSEKAVEIAKSMGFEHVYTLGSIDKLI